MRTDYDIFADVYDVQFGAAEEDLGFYMAEAQAARPPVLELACGTGRVTLPIAMAGVPIMGLDTSSGMLARAREKAARLPHVPVRWEQADMRDFSLEECFGLVIIPARSFQHLLTPEDQVRALSNILDHLLPGGRLILNLFVPHLQMIAEHSTTTREMLKFDHEYTDPDTGQKVPVWESRRYDPHTQRIDQQYRYEHLDAEGSVIATRYRRFSLCYIWPREMEHLLVRCGYVIEALYGWFDRSPFGAGSKEQIWVARRP
jgi:SAM-dependent methyltransferase